MRMHPLAPRAPTLLQLVATVLLFAGPIGGLPCASAAKPNWEPVPADVLTATECPSHPGASAEGILSRTTLTADSTGAATQHYLQIKIYSPKGAEESGVFNIDYNSELKVWGLAARLTKPDGTTRLLGESEFQERLLSKYRGSKLKRKALAIPGLDPGDVIDLQWAQGEDSTMNSYHWWYARQPYPVRRCIFSVAQSPWDYHILWFGVNATLNNSGRRDMTLEMRDIPPFDREPYSIPERDARGWYLLLFSHPFMRWYSHDDVWDLISSYREEEFRYAVKPSRTLEQKAAELIAGAASDEEKLARLYDFCRSEISNLNFFDSARLQDIKKRLDAKDDMPSADWTYKNKAGYRRHINQLFATLARAAGFEVREALTADREATLNVHTATGWVFLNYNLVLVRLGDEWRPYSPGDYYDPAGMIAARFELAEHFRCEKEKGVFVANPVSPAALTPINRQGRFVLDADGNLEGDVEIKLGGHAGAKKQSDWRALSAEEIDREYRDEIIAGLPSAAVENLTFENRDGLQLPLVIRYHLKVPGYADLAGSKMILAPGVFKRGSAPVFTAETRRTPIMFDYAWTEHDEIQIQLPENYTLDAGTSPSNVGKPGDDLGAIYVVGFKPKSRTLIYRRTFTVGGHSAIAFPATSYPALKDVFDSVARSDEHTLVIKPREPAAPPAAEAPASKP